MSRRNRAWKSQERRFVCEYDLVHFLIDMVQVVDAGISIYDDDDLGKRGRDEKKDRRDRGRDGDRRRDDRDGGRREERRGRLGFSKFIQNLKVFLSGMSAKTNTEGRDIVIEMTEKTDIGTIDMEGRTETGMRDRLEQVRSQCLTSTSLPSHWRRRREVSQQKTRS